MQSSRSVPSSVDTSMLMKTNERVFHAILFEVVALALLIPLSAIITGKSTSTLAVVGVGLSLYAVVWNFIYNLVFDKYCPVARIDRSLLLRAGHSIGFEAGLIFVTVPVIAWYLAISIWSALILEAGFLAFFFVYSIVFNWGYDKLRHQWLSRKLAS